MKRYFCGVYTPIAIYFAIYIINMYPQGPFEAFKVLDFTPAICMMIVWFALVLSTMAASVYGMFADA